MDVKGKCPVLWHHGVEGLHQAKGQRIVPKGIDNQAKA